MFCDATLDTAHENAHICYLHPNEASNFYTSKLEHKLKFQFETLRANCLDLKVDERNIPTMQLDRRGGAIVITLLGIHFDQHK